MTEFFTLMLVQVGACNRIKFRIAYLNKKKESTDTVAFPIA